MTTDVLRALQLADSAFPSGAFAYSWGLESASEHHHISRDTFGIWLRSEMLGRWAAFDRVVVAQAFRASDPLHVDAETDVLFVAEPLRQQSAEAGQAFLAACARLGDPVAKRFRQAVLQSASVGHLPVAQGAVFRSMGLELASALCVSAHIAAQGVATAAVRLGLIGALEAQTHLRDLHNLLAPASVPPAASELPSSFAPLSEIAMMRPTDRPLFAN